MRETSPRKLGGLLVLGLLSGFLGAFAQGCGPEDAPVESWTERADLPVGDTTEFLGGNCPSGQEWDADLGLCTLPPVTCTACSARGLCGGGCYEGGGCYTCSGGGTTSSACYDTRGWQYCGFEPNCYLCSGGNPPTGGTCQCGGTYPNCTPCGGGTGGTCQCGGTYPNCTTPCPTPEDKGDDDIRCDDEICTPSTCPGADGSLPPPSTSQSCLPAHCAGVSGLYNRMLSNLDNGWKHPEKATNFAAQARTASQCGGTGARYGNCQPAVHRGILDVGVSFSKVGSGKANFRQSVLNTGCFEDKSASYTPNGSGVYSVPKNSIVIWLPLNADGTANSNSSSNGHVEVSDGAGSGVSDHWGRAMSKRRNSSSSYYAKPWILTPKTCVTGGNGSGTSEGG
ncbi:hypothetical protein P2318_33960 [Myxococcaceae bacterium GXIMD 01537]